MTLVELCIVIVIVGILLTVAVATLLHARVVANESSAIAMLRTITKAEFAFANECGRGHYAGSLDQLGVARPGRDQSYLGEDLGLSEAPERNGYRFNIRPGADSESGFKDCNGASTRTTFYASAEPIAVGRTGTRSFATSQSNGIWRMNGATAPAEPFGPPAEYVR
jgi:type II secretory pathway pseudopilin PulG